MSIPYVTIATVLGLLTGWASENSEYCRDLIFNIFQWGFCDVTRKRESSATRILSLAAPKNNQRWREMLCFSVKTEGSSLYSVCLSAPVFRMNLCQICWKSSGDKVFISWLGKLNNDTSEQFHAPDLIGQRAKLTRETWYDAHILTLFILFNYSHMSFIRFVFS